MNRDEPSRVRETSMRFEGFIVAHRYLWSIVQDLQRREKETSRSEWQLVVAATLIVHMALEGLLNCIGERIFPTEWRDEKRFFGSGEYRGTLGKLSFLAERLGSPLDRGKRPFQTIDELHKIRNKLVHPRDKSYKDYQIKPDAMGDYYPPTAEIRVAEDLGLLDRIIEDVESVACNLWSAAISRSSQLAELGDHPLVGVIESNFGEAEGQTERPPAR